MALAKMKQQVPKQTKPSPKAPPTPTNASNSSMKDALAEAPTKEEQSWAGWEALLGGGSGQQVASAPASGAPPRPDGSASDGGSATRRTPGAASSASSSGAGPAAPTTSAGPTSETPAPATASAAREQTPDLQQEAPEPASAQAAPAPAQAPAQESAVAPAPSVAPPAEEVALAGTPWAEFAPAFSTEFASVLHAFGATAQDEDAPRPTVTPATLQGLFTERQRDQLMQFTRDHVVPSRLFNGDEVGHSTAQQRIMLSSHILTTGTFSPGSEAQQMHARMCGHWVQLVNAYAGAVDGGGEGVGENFDHEGNVVLGSGEDPSLVHHNRRLEEGQGVGRFDWDPFPMDQFDTLEEGDWLWIYNGNGSGGGNHSVIFSHWNGPARGNHREAVCFSQHRVDDGGHEHTSRLGETFVPRRVYPITRVRRVSEDAHPAQTVEELLPELGEGGVAQENGEFLARLSGRRRGAVDVDLDALRSWLQGENRGMISQLAASQTRTGHSRLSEGQRELLETANGRSDLEVLIRLNERLHKLTSGQEDLDSSDERQAERQASDRVDQDYQISQGSVNRSALNGWRENRRASERSQTDPDMRRGTTGLLSHLQPQPPWSTLSSGGQEA